MEPKEAKEDAKKSKEVGTTCPFFDAYDKSPKSGVRAAFRGQYLRRLRVVLTFVGRIFFRFLLFLSANVVLVAAGGRAGKAGVQFIGRAVPLHRRRRLAGT